MTHEQIQAELSSFALGALDPDEQREVEQHLASGCRECAQELESWRSLVGVIALAGHDAAPPDLKPALLRRLGSAAVADPQPVNVIPLRRWPMISLALAATALLTIGIARDTSWRHELAQRQEQIANLGKEVSGAQSNVVRLTQELAAKQTDATALRNAFAAAQESLAVLQAPGLRLVQLKQTPDAKPGVGHVLINAENGRALFYAFDLAPLPSDKVYELWWITEKQGPINAGVFEPDPNGVGRVDGAVPTDAGSIQAAAVTIEPVGGVPKPTGPMILLGNA